MPAFDPNGFAVVPDVLPQSEVEHLRALLTKHGDVHALRGLLDLDFVGELARSQAVRALIEPVLGSTCFAVRGLFFDKTANANWKVPFHQDLTIAVEKKRECAGFGAWSSKVGVPHVQPPAQILENMASVRLHLDDCDASNGALRVVCGSHLLGKIGFADIARHVETRGETAVPVPEGGAMVFRPLLIHASSPSKNPSHRRVVHLEFAACDLPDGLAWKWCVGANTSSKIGMACQVCMARVN